MKSKYFILLLSICCCTTFIVGAQTHINTNRGYNNKVKIVKNNANKKITIKTKKRNTYSSHHISTHHNQHSSRNGLGKVIIKKNRKNIIRNKPNRPVYVKKKPLLNRAGYIWIDGYWRWNIHTYVWMQGFWERERVNFHWHKGSWEKTPNGFFWMEGYWCDLL